MLASKFTDTALIRKIKNSKLNNLKYYKAIRQYNRQIGQDRLYFITQRGTYGAFICNKNANQLEKELNIILENKGE